VHLTRTSVQWSVGTGGTEVSDLWRLILSVWVQAGVPGVG
jgi:hypothetical protein